MLATKLRPIKPTKPTKPKNPQTQTQDYLAA